MIIEFANLHKETQERWDAKTFLETSKLPYSEESSYLKSLVEISPWVPYEDYMMARLVAAVPGRVGLLHIRFPPEMAEDSRLHIHLHSDRVITTMEGSGYFIVASEDDGSIQSIKLEKGHRLWMPRGVRHTFVAGKDGLVLESIHNPFIAFDDPKILTYQDHGYLENLVEGKFKEIMVA